MELISISWNLDSFLHSMLIKTNFFLSFATLNEIK